MLIYFYPFGYGMRMTFDVANKPIELLVSEEEVNDMFTWFDANTSRQKIAKYAPCARVYMVCNMQLVSYIKLRWG